ncbi:TPA: hypothetical protein HMW16_00315 [Escherichia coli]|nr:hypothetical protein [Escherichia coli O2:H1]EFN9048528.1 hypothetical protein [Escherichia coli]TDA17819.1 hypothetical protein E1A95_02475 [Escherichia coli]HAJ6185698.1 hypothetical protein [Escherichia coli]
MNGAHEQIYRLSQRNKLLTGNKKPPNLAVFYYWSGSRPFQQIGLCCMSNAGASQQSNTRQ